MALEALVTEYTPSSRNEDTTRLHLIDHLFFECLGWSKSDCITEESEHGEFADYVFLAPSRTLIVEAKKENVSFELPSGSKSIIRPIQSLVRDYKDVGRAIDQAMGYCQKRGSMYAAVSNGHQIIAFVAIKLGESPSEGSALVFDSLQSMLDNFRVLWNSLSKPGVVDRHLGSILSKGATPIVAPKMSGFIANYPGTKNRNRFQADMQIVSELVLEDIVSSSALEALFLRECYSESGALSDYSMLSKKILGARYASIFDQSAPGPVVEPAVTKNGSISESLLSESLSRRPILIIGDVGVGKTTFLRHLMQVDAVEEFKNSIALHINLGVQGSLTQDLKSYVIESMNNILLEDYKIDIYEDKVIRRAYRSELQRFERGPYGRIKESDPQLYLIKEIEFIEKLTSDKAEHIKNVLSDVAKSHRKQIVIFIDNSDQRDFETQQQAFLISQELAASWSAVVFVTLRPETFHQSLMAGGALSGYHPKAFTIAPPRIDRVIQKRLSFALKITSGVLRVPRLENVSINLSSLGAIIKATLYTMGRHKDIPVLIESISSGNVRLALDLVRMFFSSGHVNTENIVNIYNTQGTYTVPLHEFVSSIIYGDQAYYDPERSYVANIFDAGSIDPKEHFMLPGLLYQMESWNPSDASEGFIETTKILEKMQGFGFDGMQLDRALSRCAKYRLVEAVARRSHNPKLGLPSSLRITAVGIYHVKELSRMFAYLDPMALDTPINDKVARTQIGDEPHIEGRLRRAKVFLEYLDSQWRISGLDDRFLDWDDIKNSLGSDFERAGRSLSRSYRS